MTNTKLSETITWKTSSQESTKRSPAWYLAFALVSLGLIIFAVFSHSVLTTITFVVIIFSVLLFSVQPPKTITYKATKTGLASDNSVYPYKIIKTFWIVYNPQQTKTLNFETTAYLNHEISFPLGNQHPIELKLFLAQYLPEDLDREESFTDALARTLKI